MGYLGVDVGSTSTKVVIMDESGTRLLAKNYLMTAGRPVEAVRQVFRNLLQQGADKVKIAGVGVTGYGRYLVGGFIGADLIKNEITAQTRAAAEIDPEADIIEIGGQDSKLVIKRNGIVVDYHMNKACAAGTGSFIDEMAELLGVSVTSGQFAGLAFAAPYTIDLGTRCAAFMGQAVASAQQDGVPLEIITASLANSIAKNYLSKVVEHRKLGANVILTRAVFYNRAVVSAFHHELAGKKLTLAEHKEVRGAIGTALLAKETMAGQASKFKGFQEVVDRECKLTEMPPHARMSLTQMLLIRALVPRFWEKPYLRPLVRWGTELHDRWMLPHYLWEDLKEVVADLNAAGYPLQLDWFAPFLEFRFPRYGGLRHGGLELELRAVIDPWLVLGEESTSQGTARYVDSSLERMQIKLTGLTDGRYALACNGRRLPLRATGVQGEFVAGVRYRAWQPPSALHPTIAPQAPLVFDVVDLWNGRSIGRHS